MTLWNKRLSEIEFADLDAFCQAATREGIQLDYKREIPEGLAKTVAAFANTRGGLIILGVPSDKDKNTPIWPCDGMDLMPGLSEQIMQICRDRIYPSILPEISSPIENPAHPGKVFVVVRVDESTFAPHTIRNRTKVYIRTLDTNDMFDLADIDRIAMLLERRKHPEAFRESLLSKQLARVRRKFPQHGMSRRPYFWWCMIPEFPHEPVCTLDECRHGKFDGAPQRSLDGYWGISKTRLPTFERQHDKMIFNVGRYGDQFFARMFQHGSFKPLDGKYMACRTLRFVEECQQFYDRPGVKYPGLLHITIGCGFVAGLTMSHFPGVDDPDDRPKIPDESFKVERTISFDGISEEDSRNDLVFEMITEIFHAFGLHEPIPINQWGSF